MKRTIIIVLIIISALAASSCHTVNVEAQYEKQMKQMEKEQKIKEQAEERLRQSKIEEETNSVTVKPIIVDTTKYVVYETEKDDRPEDLQAVKEAAKENVISYKDYIGANGIIDYDENMLIPVWTRVGSNTTVIFNDDETVIGQGPMMADSQKWQIEGQPWSTDTGTRQIITIQPLQAGLKSDMLILTNKRLYQFILYSTKTDYMPRVTFRYPHEKKFITATTVKEKIQKKYNMTDIKNKDLISLNYDIKWFSLFKKKPIWTPEYAYDDGEKTYIVLPEIVLQTKYPIPWEGKDKIVNYRQDHNTLIIDGLYTTITLMSEGRKVKVVKRKGSVKVENPDVNMLDKKRKDDAEQQIREDIAAAMKQDDNATLEYTIKWYGFFGNGKPEWTPQYVYDDGKNTSIVMYPDALQKKIPEIWTDDRQNKIEKIAFSNDTITIEGIHQNIDMIEDNVRVTLIRKKPVPGHDAAVSR